MRGNNSINANGNTGRGIRDRAGKLIQEGQLVDIPMTGMQRALVVQVVEPSNLMVPGVTNPEHGHVIVQVMIQLGPGAPMYIVGSVDRDSLGASDEPGEGDGKPKISIVS